MTRKSDTVSEDSSKVKEEYFDLNQNPMIEIENANDNIAIFVKDILRIETVNEHAKYAPSLFKVVLFYKDGKNTFWSFFKPEPRDLLYKKIMNVIGGYFPVLKVKIEAT